MARLVLYYSCLTFVDLVVGGSLSMTEAARVVQDGAKPAAASAEDERTQATYEEEFEEESVR